MLSWKSLTSVANLRGQPSIVRMVHRTSLTVSKALAMSTNTEYTSIWYSIHFPLAWSTATIMSIVLRSGWNPHWASGKLLSETLVMSLLRGMWARIFPATESRGMPQYFPQSDLALSILVERNYGGVLEVCWHTLFLPNGHKDVVECTESCGTKCLLQYYRNCICSLNFATVQFFYGDLDFIYTRRLVKVTEASGLFAKCFLVESRWSI